MAIPTILKGETAKPIPLALAEGYDYAGCSLHVGFCGVRKTFSDLAAGGSLELRFTAEQTAGFPLGTSKAMLSLENAAGEIRFMPWAKIKVTDSPADLYDAAITIDPATLNVDDLTSGDSLGAVKTKLQAVINFLRGLKVLAVCALPFFALADVEPQYATMNDIPGDAPIMTNTAACISAATTNLNARPVVTSPDVSGRGVTFTDQYGENQNVAIEIGSGAKAAVTTNALEAAADNKVVRSAGVAVGGHAEVRNDADPLKVQGVALGWHAQVSAINGVAIGSGAQHTNETGQTSGATVASAPKAIAIGYAAKAGATDAVQLGEGVNSEPGTLKFLGTTIVRGGRVATDPAITNDIRRLSRDVDELAETRARLEIVETNGYKQMSIYTDDARYQMRVYTNGAPVAVDLGDAQIYAASVVDSKLADKADAVRNIIDDRPTFTTNDIWVCEWDGQVLSWSKSGTNWLWQNEARSRGLMRIGNSYNILDVPTHISTSWNGYPADTASVLADGYGWVLTRRNPDGAVTNTVPVAYIDDIPDIPPAVSNIVTKAYVESLGITSEETDPTVPAWAKAAQKPSYTAAEVGAATMGDIIRVVSGTNVVLVITNYNSAVHAPSMKIQRLNPETGEFETYWDETIRHGMTLDSAKEYTDNATNNLAAVKADRAFGKYTSGFGVDAPKGVTWLSGGTTVFGAGHDFAKTVTSSGEIFTLVNSGLMLTNVECPTNSAFWQLEANGETLYRVEKTSSHVVNINIHAVSVVDPYLLIDLSGWIYPEHPVARVRLDLADADWLKEEDYTGGVIPGVAAITWLGSGSANDPYICQIENLSGGDKIFAGLWYEAPGATKIIANGVSDLTKGIYYNGATYLPSVSGNELKFIRAQ